jgi:RPA family protein
LAWYQQARASGIPIDGNILREKAKKVADRMQVDSLAASNGWICRFKDRHGLVYIKLAGESAAVDTDTRDLWLERLPMSLE